GRAPAPWAAHGTFPGAAGRAGEVTMAAAMVAQAFSRAASSYDAEFGANPVGLLFRSVVQDRLLRLMPEGAHVLDVGCGTGEDALALAERGRVVHAFDVAPGMVAACAEKARARGVGPERLRVECRAAEDVGGIGATFHGAYSNF